MSTIITIPPLVRLLSHLFLLVVIVPPSPIIFSDACTNGCDLALASYHVWQGSNLTYISTLFSLNISHILLYNPDLPIPNQHTVLSNTRLNLPFSCDCLNGLFLGHTFSYVFQPTDTYTKVATTAFANLTTEDWLRTVNVYDSTRVPDYATINVTINCSCGLKHVSTDYGLFLTYPLTPADNLSSLVAATALPPHLLQTYNPGLNFTAGTGIVFLPAKDQTGKYPPLKISGAGRVSLPYDLKPLFNSLLDSCQFCRISGRAIAGISVATVAVALLVTFFLYLGVYRRKKVDEVPFLPETTQDHYTEHGSGSNLEKTSETSALVGSSGVLTAGITVNKSVEFSYEELAKATNDFNIANKIGQGGFGSVYYAELRGEKAAVKKMDMQASKEFLAELKVLTHVHHLNLVRLIGYCVEGSLFLVYEFIENGNLSQHLRGSGGKDPLSWAARVQIALDSARGLEYIHEHTVPVYIHRDIKSANILIDKSFRGKVADFGLTKLTDYGSTSMHTRLVGTFGYMPPEYAQYGDVTPKIDVYALGVVLYELISAKEAVVKTNEFVTESKGLVALFEDVLSQPDPREDVQKLVDPRLGDDYPLDSVCKMAQLAKACTQENAQLRPTMRSIVVALMTLSSSNDQEYWDVGSFYENQPLANLMVGR